MTNHNITPEELIYIDRYLQHELTEDERKNFHAKMDSDPEFSEKVKQVQLMLLGIAETGIEEKMIGFHQRILPQADNHKVRRIPPRYFAIAASVAIILSLTVWLLLMNSNGNTDLYSKYYAPDPGLMTVMGNTDKYEFEKAMVAYRNGEYPAAINAWKAQLGKNQSNDTLAYFLGAAYQANRNTDSAKIYLSRIAKQTGSSFYKDANWYMALIYLKANNRAEALSHLKLSANSKTQELINQLEK